MSRGPNDGARHFVIPRRYAADMVILKTRYDVEVKVTVT